MIFALKDISQGFLSCFKTYQVQGLNVTGKGEITMTLLILFRSTQSFINHNGIKLKHQLLQKLNDLQTNC